MAVLKRIALIALSAALVVVGILSIFLPLIKKAGALQEEYVCYWEDGAVTCETFASAYPDLVDNTEFSVTLLREGLCGEIAATPQFSRALRTIQTGGLAELLSLDAAQLTRLEQLVLWRVMRGRVWYSGGYFVWEENGLRQTGSAQGETLVLLSGSISAARLRDTGAINLELRAEAVFRADVLIGTAVEKVTAYPPYSVEGGAVYLDTGTAKRLIAAVPALASLSVSACDYIDEGALRPCVFLESLTLSFAGNAFSGKETSFHGELAYLFSDGKNYSVPAALKRVKITGGVLASHAFYLMGTVEEIDLCGMLSENIHEDAFADCANLRFLHCPNAEVRLFGGYSVYSAPCGCTVFERKSEIIQLGLSHK